MKRVALLLVAIMLFSVAFAEENVSQIINSRTTQAFTDEAISDEDLNTILEAGLAATSAIN